MKHFSVAVIPLLILPNKKSAEMADFLLFFTDEHLCPIILRACMPDSDMSIVAV
jgi:hypothetical protein